MKFNRMILKISCGALALAVTAVSISAAATNAVPEQTLPAQASESVAAPKAEISVPASGVKKSETVYVNLNPDGSPRESIVTDWLHSDTSGAVLSDRTDLPDVTNINGDEQPERTGDSLTWKLEGNDLYYQGKTTKALPLDVSITYSLDGQVKKAEEIAGKSGHLEMNLRFKNTTSKMMTISGKPAVMHTPLMAIAAMGFPDDHFSNVTVSDGTVLADGNNQLVTLVAMPGLSQSLNLGSYSIAELNDLDFPEEFTITADVTEFEMGPIGIAATTKLPNLDDIKKSDDIDDMRTDLTDLRAMQNDLERVDPDRDLRSLITDPERTEAAQLLVSDLFDFYDLNKDLLDILPKYITDENIRLYDRVKHDLKDSNFEELLEDDTIKDLITLADSLQTTRLNDLIEDYKLVDPSALRNLTSTLNAMSGQLSGSDAQKNLATLQTVSGCGGDIMKLFQDMAGMQSMLSSDNLKQMLKANLLSLLFTDNSSGTLPEGTQNTLKAVLALGGKQSAIRYLGEDMNAVVGASGRTTEDPDEAKTPVSSDTIPPADSSVPENDASSSEPENTASQPVASEPESTASQPAASETETSENAAENSSGGESTHSETTETAEISVSADGTQVGVLADLVVNDPAAGLEEAPAQEEASQPEETPVEPDFRPVTLESDERVAAAVTYRQALAGAVSEAVGALSDTDLAKIADSNPSLKAMLQIGHDSQALLEKLAAQNVSDENLTQALAFANGLLPQIQSLQTLVFQCYEPYLQKHPDQNPQELVSEQLQKLAGDLMANTGNIDTIRVLLEKMDAAHLLDLVKDYDDLRQDLRDVRPVLKSLRRDLDKISINQSLHESPDTTAVLIKMKNDLEQHRDISESLRRATAQNNIEVSRTIISTLDRLNAKDTVGSSLGKLDDFDDLLARKDAFVALSDEYRIFTAAGDGMEADLKFVMKTDEVKAPEPEVTATAPVEEKAGFSNWCKNLLSGKK